MMHSIQISSQPVIKCKGSSWGEEGKETPCGIFVCFISINILEKLFFFLLKNMAGYTMLHLAFYILAVCNCLNNLYPYLLVFSLLD